MLIIYVMISGLMGWNVGGGLIVLIPFVALCSYIWKKITNTSESLKIVKGQDIEKDINTEEKLDNKISEVSDNNTDEEIVKDAPKEEKVVSKDNNSCPRCCETITNPSETECKICGFIFETGKL